MTKRIAVLGGGAAGVVSARELSARGAKVDIFEREPQLGGLHRSLIIDGDAFDVGVFLFWERHALVASFPELRSLFVTTPAPQLSMSPAGTLHNYPFSVNAYIRAHGLAHSARAACSLLLSKIRDKRRDTVAGFAQYQMGRLLYEETGLRHYIERLYGVPDSEVGIEFATQRMNRIPDFVRREMRAWVGRLLGSANTANEEQKEFLVRPAEGFSALYTRIGQELARAGVGVHLGCSVRDIRRKSQGYELRYGNFVRDYDEVVSTLPVPIALRLIGETTTSRVEHVGLHSLFYRGKFLPKAAVLCNFTYEARWKRIGVFSRYYGRSGDDDFLTVEATNVDLSQARGLELAAEFEDHAMRYGLFARRPTMVGWATTAHAYPLFRPGHRMNVREEFERLQTFGIHCVGRQGSHQYLSSDQSIEHARDVVRAISLS
jgi:protoporphyrinogen oxidase